MIPKSSRLQSKRPSVFQPVQGLPLCEASSARKTLQQNVLSCLEEIAQEQLAQEGSGGDGLAILLSGGFRFASSTLKSDIDIDVVSCRGIPIDQVRRFQSRFAERVVRETGFDLDPYIAMKLCNRTPQAKAACGAALDALFENGQLGDKLAVLQICLTSVAEVPCDVPSIEVSLLRVNGVPLGGNFGFFGSTLIGAEHKEVVQMLDRLAQGNAIALKREYWEGIASNYERSSAEAPGEIFPKVVVSSMMKLLSIEYQRTHFAWAKSYGDLVAACIPSAPEVVNALSFFLDYRFVLDNIRLLRCYEDLFVRDPQILQELVDCCGCSTIRELQELLSEHLKVLAAFVRGRCEGLS